MALSFKKFWNDSKPALFLVAVVFICVVLLFFVNKMTKPLVEQNRLNEQNIALIKLLSSSNLGVEINAENIESVVESWKDVKDSDHSAVKKEAKLKISPSRVLSLQGNGYGGAILIMALYSDDGTLLNSVVVDHSETDGIGSKISTDIDIIETIDGIQKVVKIPYMQRYAGFGADKDIPSSKRKVDSKYVDSITGATVSFRAVSVVLQKGVNYIKSVKEKGASDVQN